MPFANTNKIQLAFEEQGSGQPVILIMGIGCQLIHWPQGFCDLLSAQGMRVIRFDNRDTGLSSKMEGQHVDNFRRIIWRALWGLPSEVPYTLYDMADDVAGLMDHLSIDKAHLVGISLGGMIAQSLAIAHPDRVATLTSIMSTNGDPYLGTPSALKALFGKAAQTRPEAIERAIHIFSTIGSPGFPFDEATVRQRAGESYDRCHYPTGVLRQTAAVFASGSRRRRLATVSCPTLALHGSADPLIPWV
ncbi:MAG TPA: alpha/beta hydrolase, partial [Myxococcales bacterium]|nr:alpha/beta hydrolase [Myxococcales bacterium]